MFFQISPVIHKKAKSTTQPKSSEDEESQPEILSLAPFTPNPKIIFNDVLIGTVATRKIQIRNPTNYDVNLLIRNSVPDEIQVSFSWETATVSKATDVILDIVWCPNCEVACRHAFTVTDGKRITRDIAVVFKSVAPKKSNASGKSKSKTKKKSPITAPLRRKPISPVKKLRPLKTATTKNVVSPTTHCLQSQYYTTPWTNHGSNYNNPLPQSNSFHSIENKENLEPIDLSIRNNSTFVTAKDDTFTIFKNAITNDRRETFISNLPQDRRETFIINKATLPESQTTFSKDSSLFTDSLEASTSPLKQMNENKEPIPTFEYKLKVLESFAFSPDALSPHFVPPKCSTVFRPSSNNNSLDDKPGVPNRLFVQEHSFSQFNLSGETYTKENLSGGTYTKLNISQGTFVKDSSSIGDLNQLDLSPLPTREFQTRSPVFLKPLESTPNIFKRSLSAITEESSMFNQTCGYKRKSPSIYQHSSPKRSSIQIDPVKKGWSKQGTIPHRTVKSTSGLNLQKFLPKQNDSLLSSITETRTRTRIITDPFLFANTIDPFMTSQIYCDANWIEEQENNFKKWLNALLTPPEELTTKAEGVDVAKVWQHCKKSEVKEAPTKEVLSMNYHSNSKLEYVRKQAQNLYRSKEFGDVLQKVFSSVETGKLSIRNDKDIHLNLKLKSDLITLLLGYNPLWLRIGLETIYNEVIPLKSNSDVPGLINFLMERFFKDPKLLKKHKSNIYAPKYASELGKLILKRFLYLVYFLDKAKMTKMIQHDPCLFCLNAQEKESRLVLIHFARETLSAVGDITKYLRSLGYTVAYVQSYIHEFNYAVKNLGGDLRDGVRLAKVMEIIQIRDDLTPKLRVPAISRLQKVHNMQVVFQSLQDHGYEIQNDISPKNIVDGLKEKTLSFLWQIIHKFEAPLMVQSATTIQKWFRSLPVMLKRRKLQRIQDTKDNAACKIQQWYRRQKQAKIFEILAENLKQTVEENKKSKAAVKIQSYWRMIVAKRRYTTQHNALIKIQAYSKGWLIRNRYRESLAAIVIQKSYRRYVARKRYLNVKRAAIAIQTRFRCLLEMRKQRQTYLEQKSACIKIQTYWRMLRARRRYVKLRNSAIQTQAWYRSILQMRACRTQYLMTKKAVLVVEERYLALKNMRQQKNQYQKLVKATVTIQQRYRAMLQMKCEKLKYEKLKSATVLIQQRWRAQQAMITQRGRYQELKQATVVVQRRFRAIRLGAKLRLEYIELRQATVRMQQRFRAKKSMEKDREHYQNLQKCALVIQWRWRAQKAMITQRGRYQLLKQVTVVVQNRFRAIRLGAQLRLEYIELRRVTIRVQQRFRAKKSMENDREHYQTLKKSALVMQQRWRAQKAMVKQREEYQELKEVTVMVQQRFRAIRLGAKVRMEYIELRQATVRMQQRFRAKKSMEKHREYFQTLKKSSLVIQRGWRAQKAMIKQREEYQKMKEVTVMVQRRFRAIRLGAKVRLEYIELRQATISVQQRFRAKKSMTKDREYYQTLKKCALVIQRRWRAQKAIVKQREEYQKMKEVTVMVQRRFRAIRLGAKVRLEYIELRQATIRVQQRFRAKKSMVKDRAYYQTLKKCALVIQRRWRAQKAMIKQRDEYHKLKQVTVMVQQRFRAIRLGNKLRSEYIELRQAAIRVQQQFRANKMMEKDREYYQTLKKSSLLFQRRWRAQKSMIKQREEYQKLKQVTVMVQQRFRANQVRDKLSCDYFELKQFTIKIQQRFRANKLMRNDRESYQTLKKSALVIQRRFRAERLRDRARLEYVELRQATIMVQQRFRAKKSMEKDQKYYQSLKDGALVIQRRLRAQKAMIIKRGEYQELKRVTVMVQQRFRAIKLGNKVRLEYIQLRKATVRVQQLFRAKKSMEKDRKYYQTLKNAALVIQRRYRANKAMQQHKKQYVSLRQACIFVQRRFRANRAMTKARTQYSKMKFAVIVIQQMYRAHRTMKLEMAKYQKLRHATFVIQRRWRAAILSRTARKQFISFKISVTTIQTHFRAYMLAKKERQEFLAKCKAVSLIQKYGRGFLARKKYGPLLTPEAVESRKISKVQAAAAVKIQAFWRGYTVRNSNIPEIVALRRKRKAVVLEASKAPLAGKTLAERCDMAIICMTNENSTLLQVLKALEDLDFITRHCPASCIRLSMILPDQLYIIMSSASRSLPEMNTCNLAAFILINFYKYPKTRDTIWVPGSIDATINVALHWCDKEAPLFSTLCTLLWLFAHEDEWKQFILGLPNASQRFLKIQSLVQRKQNMVVKTRKATGKLSYFAPVTSQKVPTLNANWGLDYDRPNAFDNAVFAVDCLLKKLDLA